MIRNNTLPLRGATQDAGFGAQRTSYTEYACFGGGTIVKIDHPQGTDGLGRRVKKHLSADADDDFDSFEHLYYNAGWQLLETRETASENGAPDVADPQYQFVWSPRYIDAPVLRDRDADDDSETGDLGVTDSGLEERLYYTNDANMNVTALVGTDGTVVERYVYDPYGRVTTYDDDWSDEVTWANSKQNPIRYCGYYFDNETGLYHVRHRMYHATLGRWLQRDPITGSLRC